MNLDGSRAGRKPRSRRRLIQYLLVLPVLVVLGLANAGTAPASPPDNDSFESAQIVSSLPFSDSGDLNGTTTEPGEPQVCNFQAQSVWYAITPAVTTAVRVDLNGSDFGVVLNVYRSFGPGLGGLSFAGCIGFGGSTQFTVPAGATYYIQAGSVSSGSAHLQLNLHEVPPPPNDQFANATQIGGLPFSDTVDRTAAGTEEGEPVFPSCGPISHTIWYSVTPAESRSLFAHGHAPGVNSFFAVYTGDSLGNLSEVACGSERAVFRAEAGRTYYLQVGSFDGQEGALQSFSLELAPDPSVAAFINPPDPSVYDTVQFSSSVFDPVGFGTIQSQEWDFGDGATGSGCCPTHRYASDGEYTAKVTVTTVDGRTASSTIPVTVRTHDVYITKMTVPQAASAGQTRQITITLTNRRYPETVQVQLAKSVAGGGFATIGTLTLFVPAQKTVDFKFSYVFTDDDRAVGKVTFQATATIMGARDALPGDNSITALPTKVK
jgi:PKD repeat protein